MYVDDLVITGAKEQEVLGFKEEMKQLFSMSDLGLLRYYLGVTPPSATLADNVSCG